MCAFARQKKAVFGTGLLHVLLLALSLLLGPHRGHAQNCQIPPNLMSVARLLSALPQERAELPPALAERLARQMEGLSESRILSALRDSGMESVSTVAVDLMAEAERLGDGGSYNPARLRSLLADLDQQSMLACVDSGAAIFQRVQEGRDGGYFVEKGVSWSEIEKKASEEKLFAAGAVLVVMVIFIAVMVLIDSGYRWIMALLYNRKACRISADLVVGQHVIDGLVITLGKGGCRYHPLNVIAFDEALSDLRGAQAVIRIEETELEVRCSGIYDTVTDFRFDRPLGVKQQRELLEHSTISPYYIRKSRDGGERATEHLV